MLNPSASKALYCSLLAINSFAGYVNADEKSLSKNFSASSPLREVPKNDNYIFYGDEIRDSKRYDGHVVKATGGEVATVHDDILRTLGLVSQDVPELKKVVTNIKPDGAKDGEYLDNIVGQMREEQDVKLLNREDRNHFVRSNWRSFVRASMLGVGITDLIYNPNNLVELNKKITVIDVDAMSLPTIPYEIFKKLFGISENEVKTEAENFFKSSEYGELMTKKLDLIEVCSGKDSPIHRQYVRSFNKIRKHITEDKSYSPRDFYFGNIRDVEMNANGKITFEANFSPINEKALRLESKFPRSFEDPSETPLLCRAQATKQLKSGNCIT